MEFLGNIYQRLFKNNRLDYFFLNQQDFSSICAEQFGMKKLGGCRPYKININLMGGKKFLNITFYTP